MGEPDTSPAFFEQLYRRAEDPWDFSNSPYEQARYTSIMQLCSDRLYDHAYEPGCSIGELTLKLAGHARRVTAVDVSASAVERARARCADLPHVIVHRGSVSDKPPAPLELIVFSEIGYYFEQDVLRRILEMLKHALCADGVFIACHWLGISSDHRLSGRTVHTAIEQVFGAPRYSGSGIGGKFLLGRWR